MPEPLSCPPANELELAMEHPESLELDERKAAILRAVVEEYVETA